MFIRNLPLCPRGKSSLWLSSAQCVTNCSFYHISALMRFQLMFNIHEMICAFYYVRKKNACKQTRVNTFPDSFFPDISACRALSGIITGKLSHLFTSLFPLSLFLSLFQQYVLAVGSSVFHAMFYGELAENKDEIHIPDVEPAAFLAMLK